MPIAIRCPSCSARLNVPDSAAGNEVECPKCSESLAIPPAFEEVDEAEERPTKKRRRAGDEDDRPRRKKGAAKKGGTPVGLLIGGGVGAVVVVGLLVYFLAGGKGPAALTVPGGALGPSTPEGYAAVGDPAVGLKLFLPGDARGDFVRRDHRDGPKDPNNYSAHANNGDALGHLSAVRRPGFTPPATPEQLMAAYERVPFVNRPQKFEVLSKKAVTLGGKPGLEFRVKELPDLWDDTPEKAEFFKEKNDDERQRVARDGKFYAILLAVNGEWTYVIAIERKAKAVDDQTVKTVADSITFN